MTKRLSLKFGRVCTIGESCRHANPIAGSTPITPVVVLRASGGTSHGRALSLRRLHLIL
jgi:hypothetical protein